MVQACRPTGCGVLESLLGPLKRSRQAVQDGSWVARIEIGFVKRLRKKRSRERGLSHACLLSKLGELGSVRPIEGDIETSACTEHVAMVHESVRYVHVH